MERASEHHLTSAEENGTSSESSSGVTLVPSYSLHQDLDATPIHTLPNEILDLIFSFLSIKQRIRTELVCKRWRWVGKCRSWRSPSCLVFDPSRWEKTDMGNNFNLTDSILSDVLSRCGAGIKHLTLSNRIGPERGENYQYQVSTTAAAVSLIGKYCPNLNEIEVGGLPLNAKALKRLALGCRNLKIVRWCMFYSKRVMVEGLAGFYERCANLESLTLELPNEIDGFEKISNKLRVLRLEKCAGKGLKSRDLKSVMSRCNFIEELAVSDYNENSLDPILLLRVLDHYRNTLKVLESTICHPKKVTFNWCTALQMLHNLEKLTMCTMGIRHECPRHPNGECFGETSRRLKILDLRGSLYEDIDELLLIKLLNRCEVLRELHLSICSNLSPEFLICCRKFMDTLKVLEAISINSCSHQEWCEALSILPNLQELQLDFCLNINDEVVRTLANKCVNLKSLRLRSTDVTDDGLHHLTSLSQLAVLDVSNSNGVTGLGIKAIAEKGHLEELYIATCSKRTTVNVTDDDCVALATCCQNFHFLDVSNVAGTAKITNLLVSAFGTGLQRRLLKRQVTLVVGGTSITKDVEMYERLEVLFEFSVLLSRSFTRTRRTF